MGGGKHGGMFMGITYGASICSSREHGEQQARQAAKHSSKRYRYIEEREKIGGWLCVMYCVCVCGCMRLCVCFYGAAMSPASVLRVTAWMMASLDDNTLECQEC